MGNPGFAKSFDAATDVPAYRLVKAAENSQAALASSSADSLLGASTAVDTAAGQQLDIVLTQSAPVSFGGPATVGDPITSDENGRAIKASPAEGQTMRIVGFALLDADVDDIAPVSIQPGFIKG